MPPGITHEDVTNNLGSGQIRQFLMMLRQEVEIRDQDYQPDQHYRGVAARYYRLVTDPDYCRRKTIEIPVLDNIGEPIPPGEELPPDLTPIKPLGAHISGKDIEQCFLRGLSIRQAHFVLNVTRGNSARSRKITSLYKTWNQEPQQ